VLSCRARANDIPTDGLEGRRYLHPLPILKGQIDSRVTVAWVQHDPSVLYLIALGVELPRRQPDGDGLVDACRSRDRPNGQKSAASFATVRVQRFTQAATRGITTGTDWSVNGLEIARGSHRLSWLAN
jgi:hypothetical protein